MRDEDSSTDLLIPLMVLNSPPPLLSATLGLMYIGLSERLSSYKNGMAIEWLSAGFSLLLVGVCILIYVKINSFCTSYCLKKVHSVHPVFC